MSSLKWLVPLAVVSATACSPVGAGAVSPPTPEERHGLEVLRAQAQGPSTTSEIFADGNAHTVAIAVMQQLHAPAVPKVDVYRWQRPGWRSVASIRLDVGGSVASDESGTTTPIRTADITPAGSPELVVTVYYNAGPATAILSSYGGRWHALVFHGGLTADGDERYGVQVRSDGTVTSQDNDCVPDCAHGHDVTTTYRFSTATGRLEATATATG
jgi:hypothetical protein